MLPTSAPPAGNWRGNCGEDGQVPARSAPLGFAHRGARLEHPDNSLAGFCRALELGAGGLETDAWVTADGVAVLDHDGYVGRGPWRRRLGSMLVAQVAHLPSIEDLYRRCGTGPHLSVDVKDPTAARPLVAAAQAVGAAGRLWLCSPDHAALARWRALDAEVHLVHSTALTDITGVRHPYRQLAASDLRARMGDHVRQLRAAGIDTVNLHHRAWSSGVVTAAREAGARAFGWDAQRREDLERAVELGLDGVYSDDVALMVAVLAEGSEGADG